MEQTQDNILDRISTCLQQFREKKRELDEETEQGLFIVKKANEALVHASLQKDPRRLWKTLWYEGEICCLFSDTNLGKSIYAVQIANEIALTENVLYFDFELSEKQFQMRYTDDVSHKLYSFPDNLYRVEINCENLNPKNFEDTVVEEILKLALRFSTRIIIIDNLTYLCSAMEKSDAAGTLMKNLIILKKLYNLSILVLAHTPKRPLWRPITQNDLQGSKFFMNLFDSSFSIGQSTKSKNLRFIKEIKIRTGEKCYDRDNVIISRIEKVGSFLQFVEQGYSAEDEHLNIDGEMQRREKEHEVLELSGKGRSIREIAGETGIPKSTVAEIIKRKRNRQAQCPDN